MQFRTYEIQAAKYLSFSVDSTPDISHTDQLMFTVRYIQCNGEPIERFLKFVPISSHTGLHMFEIISSTFHFFNLVIVATIDYVLCNLSIFDISYTAIELENKCKQSRVLYYYLYAM